MARSPVLTPDVFVSGGGIAGLAAAAAFGAAGFSVILADPSPPVADASRGADLRSTAYLRPSVALLERAGVWAALAPHAVPLRRLRVIDTRGAPPVPHETRVFAPEDGSELFGWNVLNWVARKALSERVAEMPGVELRLGRGFARLLTREGEARITLDDGTRIAARLAVAADGRASPLRGAAGIDVATTRYGQKALAFAVAHEIAHGEVSTELYARGGAFTLVPLPDHDGRPASAVVWMNEGAEAVRLHGLSDAALGHAATGRSCAVLGALTPISPRNLWPVVTQTPRAWTAERVALVAEAAHVLPPIGAQGLNTSLADIGALVDLASRGRRDPGDRAVLDAYARARARDVGARAAAIDLYNRLCRTDAAAAGALRAAGLRLVADLAPLRRRIVAAGLGPG